MCILLSLLDYGPVKKLLQQWIVGCVVFYAVRVVSKDSMGLVLPRTSYHNIVAIFVQDLRVTWLSQWFSIISDTRTINVAVEVSENRHSCPASYSTHHSLLLSPTRLKVVVCDRSMRFHVLLKSKRRHNHLHWTFPVTNNACMRAHEKPTNYATACGIAQSA
jgi:hypothetical protein